MTSSPKSTTMRGCSYIHITLADNDRNYCVMKNTLSCFNKRQETALHYCRLSTTFLPPPPPFFAIPPKCAACISPEASYLLILDSHIGTVNARFKPWALINHMVHNHPGSNRERVEIKTINLLNLLTWMDKLTRV